MQWRPDHAAFFFAAGCALDDAHDVGLLHDQEFLAVELDLGARPLAEQDAVAGLHLERDDLALLVAGARTDGDHLAFHRLFLGGIGDDDAAGGLLFGVEATDHHPVVQGTKLHWICSRIVLGYRRCWRPTEPPRQDVVRQ